MAFEDFILFRDIVSCFDILFILKVNIEAKMAYKNPCRDIPDNLNIGNDYLYMILRLIFP